MRRHPRHPRLDPDVIMPAQHRDVFDRTFWAVFLSVAVLGTAVWRAIFEYNYHPRIYTYGEDVTILQIGDSELDFNHPQGTFSIWWQSGQKNVRVWPK